MINSIRVLLKTTAMWDKFSISIVLMAFVAVSEAATVAAAIPLTSELLKNPDEWSLSALLALPAIFIIKSGSSIWAQYYISNTIYTIKARLTNLISDKLTPYALHSGITSDAELTALFTTESNQLVGYFLSPASVLLAEGVVIISICGFLLYYEPIATTIMALLMLASALAYQTIFGRWISAVGLERTKCEIERIRSLKDILGVLDVMQMFGSSDFLTGRFRAINARVANLEAKQYFATQLPKIWLEAVVVCFVFVALTVMGAERSAGELVALLSVYLVAAFRIMPSLNRVINSIQTIRYSESSVRRFASVIESKWNAEFRESEKLPEGAIFRIYANGVIKENVDICAGVRYAVIGPSGIGKTSLLKAIAIGLRFGGYKVSINEKLAGNLKIGYAPQDSYLIHGKLTENILFRSESDIKRNPSICRKVEDQIRRWELCEVEMRLNELSVGQDVSVSGGQKQRIGLVRASLTDADVLLFDEPTSALDIDNRKKVIELIKSLRKTIILVTHDEELAEACDKVIFLNKEGTIDAEGSGS